MKLDPKKAWERIKILTKDYSFKHSAPAIKNVRFVDGTVNQTDAQYIEAVCAAYTRTFSSTKAPIDASILDPIPDYLILWVTADLISLDELLFRLKTYQTIKHQETMARRRVHPKHYHRTQVKQT